MANKPKPKQKARKPVRKKPAAPKRDKLAQYLWPQIPRKP
jgi:hypothetical protein